MKPNKVLQYAQGQIAKSWKRFQLLAPRTSLDPTKPTQYIIEVQGERGDGTVFSVVAQLDKARFEQLRGPQALGVVLNLVNKTLQQLQTYTGCACKTGAPCAEHQQSQLVH